METIYIIKNTVTGRTYVGRTCGDVERRFNQHLQKLRTGNHNEVMQRDYDKYGEESFVVHPFATIDDRWEVGRMEAFMQVLLRSKERKYGYNYLDAIGTSERAKFEKWRTNPWGWFHSLSKRQKAQFEEQMKRISSMRS